MREWLIKQRKGKFIVESMGHCYSWDADIGCVLDSGEGSPQKNSEETFQKLEIRRITNLYEAIPMSQKI